MEKRMKGERKLEHELYEHRKGRGEHAKLGTTSLGIPSYDRGEPWDEPLTPLKNKFSALHDRSQDEIMRTGVKTSSMENRALTAREKYASEMDY